MNPYFEKFLNSFPSKRNIWANLPTNRRVPNNCTKSIDCLRTTKIAKTSRNDASKMHRSRAFDDSRQAKSRGRKVQRHRRCNTDKILFSRRRGLHRALFSLATRQSEPWRGLGLVTCGNRDNYNVSVRLRRVAGARGGSRNNETSSSSKGPPGGNSTLMLAPLPGNHPQSVFQSVSLLFNYPFKPYNLLLRGTAAMILTRASPRHAAERTTTATPDGGRKFSADETRRDETWREGKRVRCRSKTSRATRISVGVTWDLACTSNDRQAYPGVATSISGAWNLDSR